jgi:hypothetical protein
MRFKSHMHDGCMLLLRVCVASIAKQTHLQQLQADIVCAIKVDGVRDQTAANACTSHAAINGTCTKE